MDATGEQMKEDMELTKALRSPQAETVIKHLEDQLEHLIVTLAIEAMTPEKRLDVATEIHLFGKILKTYDDRVRNVVSLAASKLVRMHMHGGK